jgi:curved DNA-binding protein
LKLKLDYYRVLNVNPGASAQELKKAYRQLAITWHPDRNPGSPLAEERFKAISEAYAVLSDPIKRRRYDQLGPEKFGDEFGAQDIFQGFDLADLFKEFGLASPEEEIRKILEDKPIAERDPQAWQDFFAGFGQKPGPMIRPPMVAVDLTLSLREAVYGAEKTVALNTAKGPYTVKVLVPQGSYSGQKLIFKGQGPPSSAGTRPGDLAVTLAVQPDPTFSLRGQDILTDLSLLATDLKNGCQAIVKTLDGRSLKLTVKPGSIAGTFLRAPGHGVPQGKGSLLVRLIAKN